MDLRLNLSPLKDGQQLTQGVAIVLEDLTEKNQLEAQHRLFERMVSPAVIEQIRSQQPAARRAAPRDHHPVRRYPRLYQLQRDGLTRKNWCQSSTVTWPPPRNAVLSEGRHDR